MLLLGSLACGAHTQHVAGLVRKKAGRNITGTLGRLRHDEAARPRFLARCVTNIVDRSHATISGQHNLVADLARTVAWRCNALRTLFQQTLVVTGQCLQDHALTSVLRQSGTSMTPSTMCARKNRGVALLAKSMSCKIGRAHV